MILNKTYINLMGENPESNREPLVPQTNVLPIELFPPVKG